MRYNDHDAHGLCISLDNYEPSELETNQKPLDPYKQIRISGVSANKNYKHRLCSNCCVFYRYFYICYCIVKTLIIFHVNLMLQQILPDYEKIVINNPYKKLIIFVIQCIKRNYYNACIYQSNDVSASTLPIACGYSKLKYENISEKIVPSASNQSKPKRTLTSLRTFWVILFLSLKFKLKKYKISLETSWTFLYPTWKYISKKFRDNIVQTNNVCKKIVRDTSCKSKRSLALSTSKRNLALSTLGASWVLLTLGQVTAVVIPPPWANVSLNPCAKTSWQQILWKNHSKCYKIFSQVKNSI